MNYLEPKGSKLLMFHRKMLFKFTRINNGITIQFGLNNSSFTDVNLPITYTATYKIIAIPHNIYENAATISINLYTKTLSYFRCQVRLNGHGTDAPYDWISIGY